MAYEMEQSAKPSAAGEQEMRFVDRVALVTGAGRGLGRAHAKLLAARGACVAVNNRTAEHAESLVREIRAAGGTAIAIAEDVGDPAGAQRTVDRTIDAFGRIDIVINNAGGVEKIEPFAGMSTAARDFAMQQNFASAWDVTAAAWPHMVAQHYGRVVLVSSPIALAIPPASNRHVHYAAAKAALIGMAKGLAEEGAEHGIKVNVISPFAYTAQEGIPAELLEFMTTHLGAEHVAASVGWLVHESCQLSGEILGMSGPRVWRTFIAEGAGYTAAPAEYTPEGIRDRAEDVVRTDEFTIPRTCEESMQNLIRTLSAVP